MAALVSATVIRGIFLIRADLSTVLQGTLSSAGAMSTLSAESSHPDECWTATRGILASATVDRGTFLVCADRSTVLHDMSR